MTVSNIVPTPVDPTGDVYGWDWTNTTHDGRHTATRDLLAALEPALVLPGKGRQGWTASAVAFDKAGYKVGTVFYGGDREDVHVEATSDAAESTRAAVVGLHRARTSRVDTRVDTLASWDELESICLDAAESYGTQVTTMETLNGPRAGRTIYLGAPSSAIRVRIYEKWKESPGQYVDGTNRVEVQLRPPSKAKERVSTWSRSETFCASRVTTRLADALGQYVDAAGTLHVKRPTPTLEQSLQAMSDQYGSAVARWLEHSGGDLSTVLDYMLWRHDRTED